jgi:hypothetical protein
MKEWTFIVRGLVIDARQRSRLHIEASLLFELTTGGRAWVLAFR